MQPGQAKTLGLQNANLSWENVTAAAAELLYTTSTTEAEPQIANAPMRPNPLWPSTPFTLSFSTKDFSFTKLLTQALDELKVMVLGEE